MLQGIGRKMIEHAPAQAQPPKRWAHIHALDFPIGRANELDPTVSSCHALMADDEKGHRLFEQLLNTIPVMVFDRIEGDEVRIELSDQRPGVCRVRGCGYNNGWHAPSHKSRDMDDDRARS